MATAYVNPTLGTSLLVKPSFDNGNSYVAPALINMARGFSLTVSTNVDELVDNNAPANSSVTVRSVKATDSKIDGHGVLDANSVASYMTWAATGSANPCKVIVNYAPNAAVAATTITGNYILTDFTLTGDKGKMVTCSITLEQAGAITVVTA